jgi:hypothetical protein
VPLLELEAFLQLCHHVDHCRSLRRRLHGALECDIRDLPHTVDITLATHSLIDNSLNVSSCQA